MIAPKLVISDVDGTLVTHDKRLTARTRAAVAALRRRGIGFSVVSSRPPFGLKMLIEPLALDLPFAAFNGGMVVRPDLSPVELHLIGEAPARRAVELLRAGGVAVWLFTREAWHLGDLRGPYVERERHTVRTDPVVVGDFAPLYAAAGKIVGVSADFDRLEELEGTLGRELRGQAAIVRSQAYYLDVTPVGTDKGTAVDALLRRAGVGSGDLLVFGDMENDLPMFRVARHSVAMGNAPDAVKERASHVTLDNDADGVADAIERLVLAEPLPS